MKKFKTFISEGIRIDDDGNLSIDHRREGDPFDTKFGRSTDRQPFYDSSRKFNGHKVYSAYQIDTENSSSKEVLYALKRNPNQELFLSRTAQYLMATALYEKSIDLIITIKSSSELANNFAKQFNKRIPNHLYFPSSIIKSNVDKIKISPKVPTEETRINLQRALDNVRTGEIPFEMKKIRARDRKFIIDFLELDSNLIKKIENKNIVIVDDFLTAGSTMGESFRLLDLYSPQSIIGLTIIKAK